LLLAAIMLGVGAGATQSKTKLALGGMISGVPGREFV